MTTEEKMEGVKPEAPEKSLRENLNVEWADCLPISESVYVAADADEVMDKMESRIKELESELEKFQWAFLGERRAVVAARKQRDEAIAELRKLEGLG